MKAVRLGSAVVALALVGGIAAGCTSAPKPRPAPVPTTIGGNETPLVDPILELTDSSSPEFVAKSIVPVIEVQGVGPQTFTIARPSDPKEGVKFLATCAPASTFSMAIDGKAWSTECGRASDSSAGYPASLLRGADEITVSMKVPAHVHYWIVGIPFYGGE